MFGKYSSKTSVSAAYALFLLFFNYLSEAGYEPSIASHLIEAVATTFKEPLSSS